MLPQTEKPMRVLVACEYTGTVRRAFAALGHDAWSCDLLPSLDRSNKHIVGDVRAILNDGWDLLAVMHPPCTRLCNSGVRWLFDPPGKLSAEHYTQAEITAYVTMTKVERLAFMWQKLDEGAELFSDLWNAPIERVCVENPVMHPYAKERIRNYVEFTQSVQPWQYGDFETKRTCFWMRGLPVLKPTYQTTAEAAVALGLDAKAKPVARVHNATPGPNRWAERSKFFDGIANAMAWQWTDMLTA